MSRLIDRVANYFKNITGQDFVPKAMGKQQLGKLPIVITGNYACFEAFLMNVPVLLLVLLNDDYTPKQLLKHQQMVTRLTGRHVVFALEKVASYHISRMVEARVNFIIPDKMIFVPSLLINLKEVKDGRKLEKEVMPGLAQCIILYHLQRESLNGFTTKELVEKFNMSYASMSRALRWLNAKELIELTGGKEKVLAINSKEKELWEKALPLFLSPVERVFYTDEKIDDIPVAGESALERLTMMAAPERPCKAVSKEWAKEHKGSLNKFDGDYRVEVWRYDPTLLGKDNMVDPLSLFLSMRTSDDERIRIELKNLTNNISWLKD